MLGMIIFKSKDDFITREELLQIFDSSQTFFNTHTDILLTLITITIGIVTIATGFFCTLFTL